jgi:chromosome segregation ATPase
MSIHVVDITAVVENARIQELLEANGRYMGRIQDQANEIAALKAKLDAIEVGQTTEVRRLQKTLADVRFELNKANCRAVAAENRVMELQARLQRMNPCSEIHLDQVQRATRLGDAVREVLEKNRDYVARQPQHPRSYGING